MIQIQPLLIIMTKFSTESSSVSQPRVALSHHTRGSGFKIFSAARRDSCMTEFGIKSPRLHLGPSAYD
jgi:hypothetical protein